MSFRFVPEVDELFDRSDQLIRGSEVPVSKDSAAHDAKPKLNLIQPGSMGWRVVKNESPPMIPVPVRDEAALASVEMGVEIVKDDVDPALAVGGRNEVHEREEIWPLSRQRASTQNPASSYVEARKQTSCPIALVLEFEATSLSRAGRL